MGGAEAPRRLRVLDLPFCAVEWAVPEPSPEPGSPSAALRWAAFPRSPRGPTRSLSGCARFPSQRCPLPIQEPFLDSQLP